MTKQFTQIVLLIQEARGKAISAVNTELINVYWKVGAYISLQLQQAVWGEKTVTELAAYIKKSHPEIKGFERRGLYRMKQFYETYAGTAVVSSMTVQMQTAGNESDKIVSSLMTQLDLSRQRDCLLTKISWTHHLVIMSRCASNEERLFYIERAIKEAYSVRELERQINSGIYERSLSGIQVSPALKAKQSEIAGIFKDNYVFEFLNINDPIKESELQQALISQMKAFVLELGRDFLFVSEEFKLQVGKSDFFIDLLFYHRGLQCLVAFELKADKFRPEHLGQLNFYLEALDRDVKKKHENPSIGILLCKGKDAEVVEYALSRNLSPAMVAEYTMHLPDKALLQKKLHSIFEDNLEL
ncbi:PDDEXK nuclease domain-containing protein [Algoriphagus boritolerans]|uniref:Predicted nuclease of restriction endonuclease-like (RecB) superfamily, DUF1016 family n=1 Tax=Algoriphagus boritolerans DSM 17298 = JCM 18970 TaxID=1120964 RepID=A0A1H5ZWB4_9BACT|nr:PDDEXK nuclease domain-containing protein [Algoriphagus boritolerans]SEG40729.1 Predicted nuclease of restriction endonuclease-like (RecB) superfamily, DUF1016 family [Algoriphagus boritolerans DSM 17298 = JCM 18970]